MMMVAVVFGSQEFQRNMNSSRQAKIVTSFELEQVSCDYVRICHGPIDSGVVIGFLMCDI